MLFIQMIQEGGHKAFGAGVWKPPLGYVPTHHGKLQVPHHVRTDIFKYLTLWLTSLEALVALLYKLWESEFGQVKAAKAIYHVEEQRGLETCDDNQDNTI